MNTSELSKMTAFELKRWFKEDGKKNIENRDFKTETLSDVDFQNKEITNCNFTNVNFKIEQDFSRSTIHMCEFGPHKNPIPNLLRRANFSSSTLSDVHFDEACLLESKFTDANLSVVFLPGADCRRADFTNATMDNMQLTGTNFYQARFNKTRLSLKKQPILQENTKAWVSWCKKHQDDLKTHAERLNEGAAIYLELKENFRSIGAYSEASWAYVHGLRMRRSQHCLRFARECFSSTYPANWVKRIGFYIRHVILWLIDAILDLTTGYGESLFRMGRTIFFTVAVIFPLLYSISSGVSLNGLDKYSQLLSVSIENFLQGDSGTSLEILGKISTNIKLIEQFIGILMIGLLGYILGNKINQR